MQDTGTPVIVGSDDDSSRLDRSDSDAMQAGPLNSPCPNCTMANAAGTKECGYCGTELPEDAQDALSRKRLALDQDISESEEALVSLEYRQHELMGGAPIARSLIPLCQKVIFIGLLLTPILIGLPILITGAVMRHACIKALREAQDERDGLFMGQQAESEFRYLRQLDRISLIPGGDFPF